MSPRRALLLLFCVTLLGPPVGAQSSSPGRSTPAAPGPATRTTNKADSRGPSQPAVKTQATTPKRGTQGQARSTKPRAAARQPAPAATGADCDVAEVPVKAAPPAAIPPTADLLSPTVTPCPSGPSAAGKP